MRFLISVKREVKRKRSEEEKKTKLRQHKIRRNGGRGRHSSSTFSKKRSCKSGLALFAHTKERDLKKGVNQKR